MRSACLLFLAILLPPSVVKAAQIDQSAQYKACMTLVTRSAASAADSARTWIEQGGGIPARHCLARALFSQGQIEAAAQELENIIQLAAKDYTEFVPDLMGQAAQAWTRLGKLDRAYTLQSEALKRRPGDVDLLIDRAVTLGQEQNFVEAVDDLDQALKLAPRRVDALVYRATAYRYLDAMHLAMEDLNKALQLDGRSLPALLERGIVKRLNGDDAGARSDWMALLRIAPGAPEADSARANLERMDVKTR
jgi:tetratricopeptide (TPR) repeat protein